MSPGARGRVPVQQQEPVVAAVGGTMKSSNTFLLVLALGVAPSLPALGAEDAPAWAYPINPPGIKPPPDDGVPRRVPNSAAAFTLTQIRDRNFSPDWHPEDHP